ncbi:MAG: hypothetical protein K2X77_21065 [Candidatus Obscuribacterales bacterium]|nr:hypothetical protein [Candidatus Obscuribacterales bacterium]
MKDLFAPPGEVVAKDFVAIFAASLASDEIFRRFRRLGFAGGEDQQRSNETGRISIRWRFTALRSLLRGSR